MNHDAKVPGLNWGLWLILFTAIYFTVGRFSLLLALPPGYATAIFPPAGFALALLLIRGPHYWPAVWLGSYALNVWVSSHGGGELHNIAHFTAAAIATGASLQAWVGAELIRRTVGYPCALNDEKDILRLLFLGGPVSCLINANLGPLSLWAAGAIDGDAYALTSWTWWVGDSLGVLVMTPILLTLFGSPAEVWRPRRSSVSLPLLVAFVLITALFTKASNWENQELRFRFIDQAEQAASKLESQFLGYIEVVRSIERLFASVENVDRLQFHDFVQPSLKRHSGFQALEWAPQIRDSERAAFEQHLADELGTPFIIRERGPGKDTIPAARRDYYYPVMRMEPLQGNEQALGFDLGSNPARLQAVIDARDSGKTVTTRRITLIQEQGDQYGLLVLQPVYETITPPADIEERRIAFRGLALGAFRVGDIIEPALPPKAERNFDVYFYDKSALPGQQVLYDTRSKGDNKRTIAFDWETTIKIGDREFTVLFSPTLDYLSAQRGWQAWLVMAGGMLFISLLGAFLLSMSGRAIKVQKLVEQRTSELKESHELVKAIVNNAIEAIITVTDDGTIESFNPAAETLFGYRGEDILGENFMKLEPVMHGGDYPQNTVPISWRVLVGTRHEITAQRKDGTRLPLEISVGEVRLGKRRLYTGILHDLSERKKVDRMKNEFISTVSHELRTPLTSIRGSLDLVAGGITGALSEQTTEMIRIATENAKRLSALIDDILDIEKIEFSKIDFALSEQPLMAIVREAIEANMGFARRHRVEIELDGEDGSAPRVNTDKNRLIQVMNNLLSNAIKFSPSPGKVAVRVRAGTDRVRVSVQDWGEGIPSEFRPHIFGKFAQADASDTRKKGGTGLGLSISKLIIEKLGGHIDYISTPNIGSTFFFELPLRSQLSGSV